MSLKKDGSIEVQFSQKKATFRASRRNFLAGVSTAAVLVGSHTIGAGKAVAMGPPFVPPGCNNPGAGANNPNCPVCFLAGTNILTPKGEVRIEDLKNGDTVITVSGDEKPIRWLAYMKHKRRGPRWDRNVRPVKIAKGALGDHLPKADLLVSGAHCLLIQGLLIPAAHLVNGRSITRLPCADVHELVYYHIELEKHDAVFANGTPAETLQGDTNRKLFDNYSEHVELYGSDLVRLEAFAPVVERGGRSELKSRFRSIIAPIWDVRKPHDCIRDCIADRA